MTTVMVDSLTMMGVLSRVPLLEMPKFSPRYASRVRVKRGNEWVDITNRVASGTIVEVNDSPVATLDLTLLNGTGYDSLAPRVKTSPLNIVNGKYDPLLDRYNEILVEAAVSYDGSEPTEFIPQFGGYLGDRTDTRHVPESGVTLPLSVRNYAKQLQDDYIMGPIEFDGDEWASVLIQQLLTMRYDEGHLPELITLRVIGTDDFWIDKPWKVEGESTWDAIQKFAQQSNKDIRHMLDESTGEIRLTYWTPSTAMVPGWFIDAKDIRREELETSDAGNRYRVIVHWRDESGELQSTVCEDLSHRKPNEPIREMSIGEEHTELISDEAGAIRFGNAVLNGTKSPPATTRLIVPFNPYMRLHDVVQVTNDNVRSEPEVYAVEEIRRSFDPYNWNMELVASDSVKLRPEYWLSIEDRPGVAGESLPPEKIGGGGTVLPAPASVDVDPVAGGLVIRVPKPPVHPIRWDTTDIHVSTDPNFTPSASTLVASNKATQFDVVPLEAVPQYIVACYRDSGGKEGRFSATVSAVPFPADDAPVELDTPEWASTAFTSGLEDAGQFVLTWVAAHWQAVTDAAMYQVQWRRGTSGDWQSTMTAETSIKIAPLPANVQYQVRVRAARGNSVSPWSAARTATTPRDTQAPPAPTIRAFEATPGGFWVELEPSPAPDWDGFEVHWRTDTPNYTPSNATLKASGRQHRFDFSGQVPGQELYVRVVAYDTSGNKSTSTY